MAVYTVRTNVNLPSSFFPSVAARTSYWYTYFGHPNRNSNPNIHSSVDIHALLETFLFTNPFQHRLFLSQD